MDFTAIKILNLSYWFCCFYFGDFGILDFQSEQIAVKFAGLLLGGDGFYPEVAVEIWFEAPVIGRFYWGAHHVKVFSWRHLVGGRGSCHPGGE